MLYDPRWEAKTKANPLSLENLIAWLEMMPADVEYDFHNCKGACLLGLFMAFNGRAWDNQFYCELHDTKYSGVKLGAIAAARPHTFGAALARARAAQSSAISTK
jgi:hypothetical protein